jgi:colicin import membrane protein
MRNNILKKIKLPKIAKQHPVAFWVAVSLHLVLLIGLFFSNLQRWESPEKSLKPSTAKPVPKAITIDLSEIQAEKRRIVDNQNKKTLRIKRQEKQLRVLEDQRYQKQRKINQLKAKTKKEKKAKTLAEKKAKEAKRKEKIAKRKARDAEKKKKIVERQVKEAQNKEKIAKNKTREAENKEKLAKKQAKKAEVRQKLAKKQAEKAESRRKIAELEKQKIEKLRKAEAHKFEKEQDNRSLKKEIQAEEDQERNMAQEDIFTKLKISYIHQIASRVKDKWRYQGAQDDWTCKVYILQDVNGKVESVNLQSCNISDNAKSRAFKNSIERAVYKASPLPQAPDKSVFDREILFFFKVN